MVHSLIIKFEEIYAVFDKLRLQLRTEYGVRDKIEKIANNSTKGTRVCLILRLRTYDFQFAKRNDLSANCTLGIWYRDRTASGKRSSENSRVLVCANMGIVSVARRCCRRKSAFRNTWRTEKNPGPKVKRLEIFLRSFTPSQFPSNDNKWACNSIVRPVCGNVFLCESQRGLWLMFMYFRLCEFCLAGIKREREIADNGRQ